MNARFNIYLLFVASWFLHLGARIPVLGLIRLDLLLVSILAVMALSNRTERDGPRPSTERLLRILVIYAILTIPFVEWPGSVIRHGLADLVKAAVFYYFTIAFVDTEAKVRRFLSIFLACQLFRVMEPLYLHVTQGYWGSQAMMGNWEFLERLSGAPSDVINPNGLAFVVCTLLPLLYFMSGMSWRYRLSLWVFGPLCIYTLMLTGSRTGLLGLIVIFFSILFKSRRPALLAGTALITVVLGFPLLSADMQDRYLSLVGMGANNEATAEGRIEGTKEAFVVAMRRPLFGHGLGTSREANANFGSRDQPAHNLYAEAAQELGFAGMTIFVLFIHSIYAAFRRCKQAYIRFRGGTFLLRTVDSLQVWFALNVIFSFASYGLTSYEWYLLGGLSVVLQRLAGRAASQRWSSALDDPSDTLKSGTAIAGSGRHGC